MATSNIYRGVVYVNPAPRITPSRKAAMERAAQRRAAFMAEMVACEQCGTDHPRSAYTKRPSGHYVWKCAACIARKAMTPDQIWAERGGVKACTKCGVARQRDQFKRSPQPTPDGTVSECRPCRNDADRQRRWAKGKLPLDQYAAAFRKQSPADIPDKVWREMEVSNAMQAWAWWLDRAPEWWMEARASAIVERDRAVWRAARHVQRAKSMGVDIEKFSARQLERIRSAGVCHWCGVAVTKYDGVEWHATDATIDHVVALADGGAHSLDNLVCACAECNFGRDGGNWVHAIAS